jgi:putative sterol carrier protein
MIPLHQEPTVPTLQNNIDKERKMSEITVAELMRRMPKAFIPEKAGNLEAVIQYHLSGEEAGDWIITVKDGICEVAEGVAESPKMTLSADSQDYKDVILGKINGMTAFMTGKLKLAGDLNLAMKLPEYWKMG